MQRRYRVLRNRRHRGFLWFSAGIPPGPAIIFTLGEPYSNWNTGG